MHQGQSAQSESLCLTSVNVGIEPKRELPGFNSFRREGRIPPQLEVGFAEGCFPAQTRLLVGRLRREP
jgi:hypothetical protein